MEQYLMNGDIPVLKFICKNERIEYLEILNNELLPYELKDFAKNTNTSDLSKAIQDIDTFKDFFCSRMLSLSRDNAKIILNVAALSQDPSTKERLKIAFACKGLSINDNFWIKDEGEQLNFSDVCIRKNKLSEASYIIAILGKHISATTEELRPDLSTTGMFPKYWKRNGDFLEMWKTDKTTGFINTKSELICSEILDIHNINAVSYRKEEKDGKVFAVSKCISNDKYSYVTAQSIKDWCVHTDRDFYKYIEEKGFLTDFANMCVVDYILFNTDRHFSNWGFMIDTSTNEIIDFAPLFDHNQALIGDYFKSEINDLIYQPTNTTFYEAIKEYAMYSDIQWDKKVFVDLGLSECCKRLDAVLDLQKDKCFEEKEEMYYDDSEW